MNRVRLLLLATAVGCVNVPAPVVSEPVAFAPERGSMVVELRDLSSGEELPASYVILERGQARFEPDYAPSRSSPTAYSTFRAVPSGPYTVRAHRLTHDSRDTTVIVRANRTDTVRVKMSRFPPAPT